MRIISASATAVLATLMVAAGSTAAFQQQPALATRSTSTAFASKTALPSTTTTETPCATPDIEVPQGVTANLLRSAVLTNADGQEVSLGEKMGQGASVVVFLRHLG